jgi:hypothetical protein
MVGGVNAVAFDEKAITLSATASDLVVAAGDVLVWVSTAVGGTGLADPGGQVQVEIGATSYTDVASTSARSPRPRARRSDGSSQERPDRQGRVGPGLPGGDASRPVRRRR